MTGVSLGYLVRTIWKIPRSQLNIFTKKCIITLSTPVKNGCLASL